MNYFILHNRIFDYGVTPSELMVYCAISSVKNTLTYAICKSESVSRRTGLSRRTVCRALDRLQAVGLVTRRRRYRYDGSHAANGYTLPCVGGGKFKVDRSVWKLGLDAGSFAVYLFLTKTMDNRTLEAYPSLRKMAGKLRLCKNTVIAKVRQLHERGIVFKATRKSRKGNFNCNLHLMSRMFPVFATLNKKETGRIQMHPVGLLRSIRATLSQMCQRTPPVCSLTQMGRVFKRATGVGNKVYSFFIHRVVHFWHSSSYTHLKFSKRKNI